jgi:hypothetical protein
MNTSICTTAKTVCPNLALANRFIQRWDIHSRQLDDGRYICFHEPLTMDHILAHLLGDITLGIYLLTERSEARFVVIDVDDEKGLERLLSLATDLASEEIPAYLEESRRGSHLWLFFDKAVRGSAARAFTQGLLTTHQVDNVEIFPKQDELSGGPGSLIRMPFGVHRLTGYRYGFVDTNGKPLAPTILKQIHILSSPLTVQKDEFDKYQSYSPAIPKKIDCILFQGANSVLSERIKNSITVMDFVGRYVDLSTTGAGAIGHCPFHDDHRPSFGVNDNDNYWHCFAGCGGGSIIDFWMKKRDCDLVTAITELARLLL